MKNLFQWIAGAGLGVAALAGCAAAGQQGGTGGPYVAYVVSESADQMSRVEFGPGGARVAEQWSVSVNPVEPDGPHGIAASPDGRYVYVTLGHGTPFGTLWKYDARTGRPEGRVMLGLFPATVAVTPDGEYAFVSNFNLHGDHVPSSISKVYLPTMTEVARTETCIMPHGSRINAQGTKQYSTCMMDEMLVEIDVGTGEVSRRFSVKPGAEGPITAPAMDHSAHAQTEHSATRTSAAVCSPTWAHPSVDGSRIYVACNRSAQVLEIDATEWRVTRRFATGAAPYNLDVTPDGRRLLVTLKNRDEPATEVIDLGSGGSLARVPNSDVLPHGLAVSPDSRYAFVSVEGVGAAPGKVDVIDLVSLRRVADVGVGQQAGGIAVLGAGGR
ncbi:MAG: YncE family protein [Gemmatimonadota bacterium]|nr:YncE family protein [Gemmatimonadota bacterium]